MNLGAVEQELADLRTNNEALVGMVERERQRAQQLAEQLQQAEADALEVPHYPFVHWVVCFTATVQLSKHACHHSSLTPCSFFWSRLFPLREESDLVIQSVHLSLF